jgi:predicted nucleotidyltransferase
MWLPAFDNQGNLPTGVYTATLNEVIARFGHGTPQRELVTTRLRDIYHRVSATGKVLRFILFGSYVTAKPDPNDVDIILIMRDDFQEQDYTEDVLPVFDHLRAHAELGASVFWTRPGSVLLETVGDFIAHWQITRERTQRGIVEILMED